jgi:glyoxylase-like metal-dependent hydrolase (beta-lactamase superfamily II)
MADRRFGRVRLIAGAQNGKYPDGNSLWIEGSVLQAVVDPALSVSARGTELAGRADLVLLTHPHEDHAAGLHLFPEARVAMHQEDLIAARGIEGLMQIYGYGGELAEATRAWVTERFNYVPRPDAEGFADGACFDLGGSSVRVFHTPGHTRGHCVFRIEPEGVLFLGDIELSSFGPYYGDAWSDLGDFERSIERVRAIDAEVWISFHHVGVIEQRAEFIARLDRFAARIREREDAMLAFLATPHTLEEMARHRFIYPPHADLPFIEAVELRSISQHLARLAEERRIEAAGDGAWIATAGARS